jgi:2,3-bisphosphoglycerate-independent phosphoglycerate mutase
MGLASHGNVHSSLLHLTSLIQFCKASDFPNFYLHMITDGRDSPPNDGENVVAKLSETLRLNRAGKIASVIGRYYAMDRDRRWERTKRAYDALVVGEGKQVSSANEAINMAYAQGQTDEFIEPTVVMGDGKPVATIDDNDAVIFFNFRIDRPRQLTMAFVLPDFDNLRSYDFGHEPIDHGAKRADGEVRFSETFARAKWPKNLFFVTMTEYQKGLPVSAIAFPPETVTQSLGEVIAENNLRQLHLSESEKERFVTYYFDGLREEPFNGEDRKIVPSPKVATYDKKPEMSAFGVVDEIKKGLARNKYSFIIANFANADMVAHSGSMPAAMVAISALDRAIGMVVGEVLKYDGTVFITADHGNAENMLDFVDTSYFFTTAEGELNTDHSNNPVPFIAINKAYQGKPVVLPKGALYDVAPTILRALGLAIPAAIKGRDLLG